MYSATSAVDKWSRTRFGPVLGTLNNCHVWGVLIYVLEPRLYKPGLKILEWDPSSRRGVNMEFNNIHSTQVGLVLNMVNGSMTLQFHTIFDYMMHTVANITASYPELCIRLVMSSNSRIWDMLYQEDDIELDEKCLVSYKQLTNCNKDRE